VATADLSAFAGCSDIPINLLNLLIGPTPPFLNTRLPTTFHTPWHQQLIAEQTPFLYNGNIREAIHPGKIDAFKNDTR
jgi:hypothetical protein